SSEHQFAMLLRQRRGRTHWSDQYPGLPLVLVDIATVRYHDHRGLDTTRNEVAGARVASGLGDPNTTTSADHLRGQRNRWEFRHGDNNPPHNVPLRELGIKFRSPHELD